MKSRGFTFQNFEDLEKAHKIKEEYCEGFMDDNDSIIVDTTFVSTRYPTSNHKMFDIGSEKQTSVEPVFESKKKRRRK